MMVVATVIAAGALVVALGALGQYPAYRDHEADYRISGDEARPTKGGAQ